MVMPRHVKIRVLRVNSIQSLLSFAAALASLFLSEAHATRFQPVLSLSGQSYATETQPNARVDLSAALLSEAALTDVPTVPLREFHLYSFFETSKLGDSSFDIDATAIRYPVASYAHGWIGRNHPLIEGIQSTPVSHTSAIGTHWVQNQSNALQPRVAGWIGGGVQGRLPDTGLFLTLAFSPIYIPTFSPRLELSRDQPAQGSRFARLPPQYYIFGENKFPMRYQIQADRFRDIILQEQYFVSVGHESSFFSFRLLGWSAPSPIPHLDTSGKLKIDRDEVSVLVTVQPQFPRERHLAAHFGLPGLMFRPIAEIAYETTTKRVTFSSQVEPYDSIQMGYLHQISSTPAATPIVSANYAEHLVWGEAVFSIERLKLHPSLRIEQHLGNLKQGQWIYPKVTYLAEEKLNLFASASMITGQNESYFGTWRSLDSVSIGVNHKW